MDRAQSCRPLTRSASHSTPWPDLLEPVALAVLDEPTQRLKHGAEWRYGRRGSMTLHVDGPRRGTWKDFEAGQGGGVLALLAHIESLDKPATVDWLRQRGFLDTDSPAPTPKSATPSPPFSEPDGKRGDYASRLWHRSTEIPLDTRHPSRLWLAQGHRSWAGIPLGPSIRWLAAADGPHVGSLIAAFAAHPRGRRGATGPRPTANARSPQRARIPTLVALRGRDLGVHERRRTLDAKSTLGDWPDIWIAANPRKPSCMRCQRRLAT